ncbi:RDD family protein [Parapedobacter tibetensis]|uniref:RDD family protein n=1 Tax=Parapedobacter tibetensis TaxID=2972951 RepID=UPI00214D7615|nr:RDD family protein [Parapedobacter tibetensis]
MNTIEVSTTQNIDIEYDVAGLGERIAAWFIDMGIFILLYLAGVIFVGILAGTGASEVGFVVLLVIYALLYVFYDLVCEVFFNGQSVGKRAMKIRVISLDGTQPTIGQYLLRWLFRIVDFVLTSGVGAIISVAATKNKQRIGDIVAHTTLIKTTPRTQLSAVAFRPLVSDDYQPLFPEIGQLSDRDMELIHEVLQNFTKSGNNLLIYNMANKLKNHLKIQIPQGMNEMQFLHTVVKDYNFITARDA